MFHLCRQPVQVPHLTSGDPYCTSEAHNIIMCMCIKGSEVFVTFIGGHTNLVHVVPFQPDDSNIHAWVELNCYINLYYTLLLSRL